MKAATLKGNFIVTPEQLKNIYSVIRETLNPVSANGAAVLEFATKAEKVGKFSGMPMGEVEEKTGLAIAEIEAALDELVKLDILVPSNYKELYQLNTQNVPQVLNFEVPDGELILNIKLATAETKVETASKPAKAAKAAVEPQEEMAE